MVHREGRVGAKDRGGEGREKNGGVGGKGRKGGRREEVGGKVEEGNKKKGEKTGHFEGNFTHVQ